MNVIAGIIVAAGILIPATHNGNCETINPCDHNARR